VSTIDNFQLFYSQIPKILEKCHCAVLITQEDPRYDTLYWYRRPVKSPIRSHL